MDCPESGLASSIMFSCLSFGLFFTYLFALFVSDFCVCWLWIMSSLRRKAYGLWGGKRNGKAVGAEGWLNGGFKKRHMEMMMMSDGN